MVTSTVSPTPSASMASAATAFILIASVFFTSVVRITFSAAAHQRNSRNSSANTLSSILPSSSSSLPEEAKLRWIQQREQLEHPRKTRSSDDYETKTQRVRCYHCMYKKIGDHEEDVFCKDPFESVETPEVICPGQCFKAKHKLVGDGLMVVRGCKKDCKEHVDASGYTRCCGSPLCNRSTSFSSTRNIVGAFCSTLIGLLLVRRLAERNFL